MTVAAMSIAALAGCGGGGGGAPASSTSPPTPAPAPAPTPSSDPIAPQLTVPEPVGYDADHLAAFNRVNELRVAAGLGMLAQNADMDKASQAHAEWEFNNDTFSHFETVGTPGFTGASLSDRLTTQGYALGSAGEVLCESGSSRDCVDMLFNAVYHRQALLSFRPVDTGVGWVPGRIQLLGTELVVDFGWPSDGSPRSNGQEGLSAIDGAAIWPVDGAASVPFMNGDEVPNPVPSLPNTYLGTAASVSVDSTISIDVNTFTMKRALDGVNVDVVLLDEATDPNQLIESSFVAIIPTTLLEPETQYTVQFDGALGRLGEPSRRAYSKTWSFTTGTVLIP